MRRAPPGANSPAVPPRPRAGLRVPANTAPRQGSSPARCRPDAATRQGAMRCEIGIERQRALGRRDHLIEFEAVIMCDTQTMKTMRVLRRQGRGPLARPQRVIEPAQRAISLADVVVLQRHAQSRRLRLLHESDRVHDPILAEVNDSEQVSCAAPCLRLLREARSAIARPRRAGRPAHRPVRIILRRNARWSGRAQAIAPRTASMMLLLSRPGRSSAHQSHYCR
jgi:hypothetical protein